MLNSCYAWLQAEYTLWNAVMMKKQTNSHTVPLHHSHHSQMQYDSYGKLCRIIIVTIQTQLILLSSSNNNDGNDDNDGNDEDRNMSRSYALQVLL